MINDKKAYCVIHQQYDYEHDDYLDQKVVMVYYGYEADAIKIKQKIAKEFYESDYGRKRQEANFNSDVFLMFQAEKYETSY